MSVGQIFAMHEEHGIGQAGPPVGRVNFVDTWFVDARFIDTRLAGAWSLRMASSASYPSYNEKSGSQSHDVL